jgi:hypothetical protein
MLRNILFGLIVVSSLAVALPAAAIAPILSQTDAAEADNISVSINGDHSYAIARGCNSCPIKADIDAHTQFFLRGEVVPRGKTGQLAGEAGTIIFTKGRVIRVHWDTGSLK